MQAVVVTGASTGIGYAIAKVLISHGITVFGSVRKESDAQRLAQSLGPLYVPLIFDVTEEEKVQAAAHLVREKLNGHTLTALINNAGIVVAGPLIDLPIADFKKQLDINVTGALIVTQAFVPLLGADQTLQGPPGKIINMSSIAGKMSLPFVGPYAASKHALEGLSESLRRELMLFGIDVIIIGPGTIATPIWDKAKEEPIFNQEETRSPYYEALTIFKKYVYENVLKEALPADVLGELSYQIIKSPRPKVRYAVVPKKWKNWTIPRLLPKRFMDKLIAKHLHLMRKKRD